LSILVSKRLTFIFLASKGQAKQQKQHWQDLHIAIGQQSSSAFSQGCSSWSAQHKVSHTGWAQEANNWLAGQSDTAKNENNNI